MKALSFRFLALLGMGLLVFQGCDCGPDEVPEPTPASIISFSADRTTVFEGDDVTLSWETEDALEIAIATDDGETVDLGDADAAAGSVVVSPAADTVYTLTARGEDGTDPATATVAVTVNPIPIPGITFFTADPETIVLGDSSTLSWETTNVDSIEITDDGGNTLDLTGLDPIAGSFVVSPEADTVYTMTATGRGGEDTATATVTVTPAPEILSFAIDPTDASAPGTEFTLSWEAVGVTALVIQDDAGNTVHSTADATGTVAVTPERSTVYTLSGTGAGGIATPAQVTALVTPVIEVFTATPETILAGDAVTFAWETLAGAEGALTGPGLTYAIPEADLAAGTHEATLDQGGTYTLTLTSGALEATATVTIALDPNPRINSFAVIPETVTADASTPVSVNLRWNVENADTLALTADTLGTIDLTGATGDEIDVEVTATTVFTLTATNGSGTDEATATVTAIAPPVIDSFVAARSVVGTGETVELTWDTTNATQIALVEDGVGPVTVDAALVDHTLAVTVTDTATYTLTARNSLGAEVSASLTITVAAPTVTTFTAAPETVAGGESSVLSWETVGGATLTVSDGTTDVCTAADLAEVAAGSCTVTPTDTTTYTLTVENGSGSATADAVVTVTSGPEITAFTASETVVTTGGQTELSWTVSNDPDGATPTLALTDDQGNTVDISTIDPNAGSVTVTFQSAGTYVFTLTATTTTAGSTPDTATLTIEVVAPAEIVSFTATPDVLDTVVGPTTSDLTWAVNGATSVSLFTLDATGAPVTPAIFTSTDLVEVAGHTVPVTPTATTRYLLVATNAAGDEDLAEVTVGVDAPIVTSFTASDGTTTASDTLNALEGSTVTLDWVTDRATSATIDPLAAVTPLAAGFTDISTSATAVTLDPVSLDDGITPDPDQGFAIAGLPFDFPYYGERFSEIAIMANGYVILDVTGVVTGLLLPFLADLDGTNGGTLHMDQGSDAQGQYVVLQWTGFEFWAAAGNHGDLTFQVVLRDDGRFAYHYGPMTDATDQNLADGAGAYIGFDLPSGTEYVLSNEQAVTGGLTGQGWTIDPTLPATGSTTVTPTADTTYVLAASNAGGSTSAQVTVRLWPDLSPGLFDLTATPTETQVGDTVSIEWTVQGATQAYVADLTDPTQVLGSCTAVGDPVVHSVCEWTPTAAGTYDLVVVASNPVSTGTLATPVTVTVLSRFEIVSFEATPQFIATGESATLAWTTEGATEGTLETSTGDLVLTLDGTNLNAGSGTVSPTANTDYVLTIRDTASIPERVATATVTVYVDAAQVLDFSASTTQVAAGDPVTLTWDTENADTVSIVPDPTILALDPATDGFMDISGTGTALSFSSTDGATSVAFPTGFEFPFYGTNRTEVVVAADGFLRFDGSTSGDWSNDPIPNTATPDALIAPFWDDLTPGDAYWQHFTGQNGGLDHVVVQWSSYNLYSGTADLNFQVVLFSDGTFDLRYGTMSYSDPARANGSSATIGYENDAGTEGVQFSYNSAYPGGLSDRGWHFVPGDIPVDGATTVNPTETTTYEICATGGGYTDCQEITVLVLEPGVVMISEFLADTLISGDSTGEWVELYNTTAADIDIAGWILEDDGTDNHTIDAANGTTVVPAGGYLVLGRSADTAVNGGYTPDYVYGGAFNLANSDDEIVLTFGAMEIDRITYDKGLGYDLPAGYAKSADPRLLTGDPALNDPAEAFCNAIDPFGDAGQYGTPGAENPLCTVVHNFSSSPGTPIVDQLVTDTVAVSVGTCNLAALTIDVDITHEYRGDMAISLTSPDGTSVQLQDSSFSDSTVDLIGTYPTTLTPVDSLDPLLQGTIDGDWTLTIDDTWASSDHGVLNSWAVNVECRR